ncbi:MAG: hypothetical protein WCV84_04250 [Patescibacteria group bacterium]
MIDVFRYPCFPTATEAIVNPEEAQQNSRDQVLVRIVLGLLEPDQATPLELMNILPSCMQAMRLKLVRYCAQEAKKHPEAWQSYLDALYAIAFPLYDTQSTDTIEELLRAQARGLPTKALCEAVRDDFLLEPTETERFAPEVNALHQRWSILATELASRPDMSMTDAVEILQGARLLPEEAVLTIVKRTLDQPPLEHGIFTSLYNMLRHDAEHRTPSMHAEAQTILINAIEACVKGLTFAQLAQAGAFQDLPIEVYRTWLRNRRELYWRGRILRKLQDGPTLPDNLQQALIERLVECPEVTQEDLANLIASDPVSERVRRLLLRSMVSREPDPEVLTLTILYLPHEEIPPELYKQLLQCLTPSTPTP